MSTTSAFWNDLAPRYDTLLGPVYLRSLVPEYFQLLSLQQGAVLADVGCGTGAVSKFALKNYNVGKIYACDFSQEMVQLLPQDEAKLEAHVADAQDLSQIVPTESCDAAIAAFVYMFVSNKQAAFTDLHRLLKKNAT